jgi:hypothetical protein
VHLFIFVFYLLQGSTIPTYQKLNAFMESAKPSVYTKGNSQGLDRYKHKKTALIFAVSKR